MNCNMKKLLSCCFVFVLVLSGCKADKKDVVENKVVEEEVTLVPNDLYVEPLQPTNLQKKAYNKLSEAVKAENYELEAKMTAISFALDFFTLSNKKSSEDVGGMQFIPTNMSWEFKEFAQAYFYNNYNYIVNTYGKDSLCTVNEYKVNSITSGSYEYYGHVYEGYCVDLSLGYDITKVESSDLKKNLKITVINMHDFKYDRNKVYKDYTDFTGDKVYAYKVIKLK